MSELAKVTIEEATADDGRQLFDARAKDLLGISGDDFIDGWDRGEFRADDRLEVMKLAMLLPFAR
jgi:hypothetical protein